MTQELVKGLPYNMTPFAIFDLDGTLIDSMPFWDSIDHEMLTARGVVYDPVATTEATKALEEAACDEEFDCGGENRHRGGHDEERCGGHEHGPAPVAVAERAQHQLA